MLDQYSRFNIWVLRFPRLLRVIRMLSVLSILRVLRVVRVSQWQGIAEKSKC